MKVHELVDTFDGAGNPLLSLTGGATRTGGRLSLPMVDYRDPTANAGSTVDLDLTGSRVVLELVTIPTSVRSRVRLTLTVNDGDDIGEFFGWWVDAGQSKAFRYIDQTQTTGWQAPFDPVAHRWVSMRHEPGVILWATSPDGIAWTDRAVLATNMPVDAMRLTVSTVLAELADPNADDGVLPPPALVDNLNAPPVVVSDDPLTTIDVEGAPHLAVDVLPTSSEAGSFVLDVSELDGIMLLGWGDYPGGWVNVVCDVTAVRTRRGVTDAFGALVRTEAGSCTVELTDTERRFDPTVNADAIHPGTPLRVRAWAGTDPSAPEWSTVLFTGKINGDGIVVTYSQTDPPAVTVTASDLIATLNRWESAGHPDPGIGVGDDLLERVQRVLAEVGIGNALAIAPDPTYAATLAGTDLTNAGSAIAAAVEAEQGRVWATVDNLLAVRARGAVQAGPVRGTLSDWHGEAIEEAVHCCYTDPAVRYSPAQLVNRVVAGRSGSDVVVQLDDEISQARYDVATEKATSLELETDEQVEPWAGALIRDQTEPRVRVESVAPAPWSAPEAWQAVLATDIGDRWYFRYHPNLGPTVRQAVGVLGIEHDIAPDGWSIKWSTAWAPEPGENPTGWFLLDLSTLDGGDLLAPFS